MPPIQLPWSLQGTLQYTPYAGANPEPVGFNLSGQFSSKTDQKYEIPGAATTPVYFGTVPGAGAKLIAVFYDQGSAPIMFQLPGGIVEELSPGGMRLYVNPAPAGGIVAGQIVTTSAATVRVVILG